MLLTPNALYPPVSRSQRMREDSSASWPLIPYVRYVLACPYSIRGSRFTRLKDSHSPSSNFDVRNGFQLVSNAG